MKIISRYIVFRHFLPVLGLALSAFTGLYLIIDFFEKVDDFLERDASAAATCAYFLYKIPFIVVQGIPMSALLAAIITLGILKRNREIVALEAAGVKSSSYAGPIVVTAVILSFMHFGLGETVVRHMNQKSEEIWNQQVKHRKSSASWIRENIWYRGQDVIYQIHLYDKSKQALEKVTLFFVDPRFKLAQRLDAKRFRWENNSWIAEEGLVLRFNGSETEEEVFQEKRLELPESPADFASLETIPEELDWLSLYNYTRKIRQEGYNSTTYEVELNLRTASPLTTLILVLLGIVIALRQGQNTGIAFGVGTALAVASIYLTVLQIGCSLSTAGILPPLIGVWSGNVLFAALAGYLWER